MTSPDLTPEVRSIGRYRLVRRLGAGGFAVVWLALDTSLEAEVAVKIMAENWASRTDLRERFLREAQLLRSASSRRVVQVHDIGELPDGRPYFVMEYADRGTLEDRISAAPLALDEALRTTAEVAEGVADLHDAGIVHRDVKPSNVLITSDRSTGSGGERLVLADLGVAKSLAQASRLTMSVGSAGYQAPEQAEPNTDVDVRADVYSLGALGYRLVTGTVPGAPGKIAPPTSFRAGLPAPVASALMSALAPDRDDRPASARAFAATLRSLPHSPAAAPGSPFPDPPRSRRPRRWVRFLAAALVVVLAGAGGGLVYLHQQDGRWLWERSTPSTATVLDATRQIEVRVPRAWAVRAVPGGWNPASIGLPGGSRPGLLVLSDLPAAWDDLGQDVDGIFVGRDDDAGLARAVRAVDHPNCEGPTRRTYQGPRWTGEIRRWDDCRGGSRSVEEILLTPAGGSAPTTYAQIRQSGEPDRTTDVLNQVHVRD